MKRVMRFIATVSICLSLTGVSLTSVSALDMNTSQVFTPTTAGDSQTSDTDIDKPNIVGKYYVDGFVYRNCFKVSQFIDDMKQQGLVFIKFKPVPNPPAIMVTMQQVKTKVLTFHLFPNGFKYCPKEEKADSN